MRPVVPILALLLASTFAPATASEPASAQSRVEPASTQGRVEPDFRGTVALRECSGSIVRWAGSRPGDRALMLTNGHCTGNERVGQNQVVADLPDRRPVSLLNRAGRKVGSVLTDRLLYATMKSTDVALYRLRVTYGGLQRRFDVAPLEVAGSRIAPRADITIPAGYNRIQYHCGMQGFVYRLREGRFTWDWSLRYRTGRCRTVGGTSGAPVLDTQRRVSGINNTGTIPGYDNCELGAPCELSRDGDPRSFPRRSYGQQTWKLTTCLDADQRLFDPTRSGCRLPDVT